MHGHAARDLRFIPTPRRACERRADGKEAHARAAARLFRPGALGLRQGRVQAHPYLSRDAKTITQNAALRSDRAPTALHRATAS